MKFLPKIFFITILTSFLLSKNVTVLFEITTIDTLPAGEIIYITGNHPSVGGWNPDSIPLTRISPNLWMISLDLPIRTDLEYKFTRGAWEMEEVSEDGTVPGNKQHTVKKDKTITHTITGWKDLITFPGSGITGQVRYHRNFYSPQLDNQRDILAWLPNSYNEDSTLSYPVLYMHDGQNIVDPKTSFIGKDWRVDEVADSLINLGEIEEIIIVGINNTEDRESEYSPKHNGELYSLFLVETVKPFIDRNYRTKADRENTAVMGSSMGGIISFHLAWEYDDIFSKAACLSPAFLVDHYEIVKRVRKYRGKKKDIKIYIDNGTVGLEAKFQRGVDRIVKALKKNDFKNGENLVVVITEGAEHNEVAWSKRIYIPLKFFFTL